MSLCLITGSELETKKNYMTKICEKCGSISFQSEGFRGNKQRLTCKGCGKWTTAPIIPKEAKEIPEANTPIEPLTSSILKKIGEKFTSLELQAIANGGRLLPGMAKVPIVSFEGTHIKIGAITDTHIGSKYFKKERLFQAFDEFVKEGVNFVTHSGDVTEGMSNRPGHIYELDKLGYNDQREEAIEVLSYWKGKMYLIDGNHDRWFIKSNGALIVQDIAKELPDAEFLGHDEGDISLNGFATLKLWHGEDGSSYAVSYRIQKVVESLSGGEKPQAMFYGHTHKATYLFDRNIHCYSMGCIESQSKWMRGKRISAHTGFWIIDLWVNEQGISKAGSTFYPFYT